MKISFLLFSIFLTGTALCQTVSNQPIDRLSGSPLVSFWQFEILADSVEKYREPRLVSVQKFVDLSKEKNTIILDTRSRAFFDKKHVKGAINLPFADFTQGNLEALIPDKNTRILIYCNNNFMKELTIDRIMVEDPAFMSKSMSPKLPLNVTDPIHKTIKNSTPESMEAFPFLTTEDTIIAKTYTLALNIPTFINLYGYGYRNIYELKDLVATSNSADFQFEGTAINPDETSSNVVTVVPSSPLVSYSDMQELINLVKPHRAERLVTLDQFNQMKLDKNTVILDTRSKEMYDAKHVKGAIHLEFSDFTQSALDDLLKDQNKRILIYCNNNFITDLEKMEQDRYFMSKTKLSNNSLFPDITLALNIPTYINLFGYGYENVFELNELVVTSDPRIQFEGSAVE